MPSHIGCDKPPIIGGYRPDVFAIDAPLTTTIIGEAKTAGDLETDHTHKQIADFTRFLCLQTNPVFVLGVPWQARARGLGLVNSIIARRGIEPSSISIAQYHGSRGKRDNVRFIKGEDRSVLGSAWDRIYVTTLFSFEYAKIGESIDFALYVANGQADKVFVGGIAASLNRFSI
jgi:hypothetical protein